MSRRSIFLVVVSGMVVAAAFIAVSITNSGALEPQSLEIVVSPRTDNDDPCLYPQPTDRDIDETEAVAAAECFVIQNGYTDLPPLSDRSRITPENVDPLTDEFGMSLRRDSLERRAATVTRDNEFWGGSWVVMFRMKGRSAEFYGESSKALGRAVVIDFYGKDIRIQHSPYGIMQPGAKVLRP